MVELRAFRQPVADHGLADPIGCLREQLAAADLGDLRGKRVALALGSRGISRVTELAATVVAELRRRGAEPFAVPAMGSHGAADAAGQVEVLARLQLTAERIGAPILPGMDTVVFATTASGLTCHLDARAAAADGIVLLNRVKPHTSYTGRFESGVVKQLAVGLGKAAGAVEVHRRGVEHLAAAVAEVGLALLARAPIIAGVAVVEDGLDQLAAVEVIRPEALADREPELLSLAKAWLPRLPFDQLDVLVVEQLGKDISGTGMDPNVIGRHGIPGVPEPATPRIRVIVALDLSPATGGNGLGLGLADLTTRACVAKLDLEQMATNALTVGLVSRVKVPLACADETAAVATAIGLIRDRLPGEVRLCRVRDTRHLEMLWLAPALWAEARERGLWPAEER